MRKLGQQKLGDLPMLHTANTSVNLNSYLLSTEAALKLPAAGSPSESLTCEGRKKKRGFAGNKLQRSPLAEMSLLSPHLISEATWAFADTFSVGNLPRKLGAESWIWSRGRKEPLTFGR